MTHRTSPPTTTSAPDPVDIETMRTTAAQALALSDLPADDDLAVLLGQLRGHLALMIPEVEDMAGRQPGDRDLAAVLALAGVREARRKLDLPDRYTAGGRFALARRLARVLAALCTHYDGLGGGRR